MSDARSKAVLAQLRLGNCTCAADCASNKQRNINYLRISPPAEQRCERPHILVLAFALQYLQRWIREGSTIPKQQAFNDCVILEKDAFDPDLVFMDDIVDDDVLPKLSLAVDGLMTPVDGRIGNDQYRTRYAATEQVIQPSTTMPNTRLDPEQLEVYGWESTIWRKIRGYLGF